MPKVKREIKIEMGDRRNPNCQRQLKRKSKGEKSKVVILNVVFKGLSHRDKKNNYNCQCKQIKEQQERKNKRPLEGDIKNRRKIQTQIKNAERPRRKHITRPGENREKVETV